MKQHDNSEAMRLADELVAPIGTQTSYQTAHEAAALLRKLPERIAELEAERDKWKSAEHALSESYVRVRAALGAMCPPSLETVELWAYVEATALAVTTERDRLREELAEQAAIYGAATHIHSELRSIVQAGGSDEAIGREFRKRVLSEIADAFASLRGEVESLRAVSDEYNHWVRFHAAGDGDYDDFIVTHCRHDNARTTHKETE